MHFIHILICGDVLTLVSQRKRKIKEICMSNLLLEPVTWLYEAERWD